MTKNLIISSCKNLNEAFPNKDLQQAWIDACLNDLSVVILKVCNSVIKRIHIHGLCFIFSSPNPRMNSKFSTGFQTTT